VPDPLTQETAAGLVSRFHGFDDGVVIDIALTFGRSAAENHAVVTVQAKDEQSVWHDVTFSLAGVATYCLKENPRQFHRVLSDGLAILWDDDGTVTLDIENLGRAEESAWFLRAGSCSWSERESA
jgi:hypothetical protein